jgi:uncharacterized membrane protein
MTEGEPERYNTNPLDPKVAERAEEEMGAERVDTEAPTRQMPRGPQPLPIAGGPTETIGDPTGPAQAGRAPVSGTVPIPPARSAPIGEPTHGLYTPPPGDPSMHVPPPYPQPYSQSYPPSYPAGPTPPGGSAGLGLKPNFAAMLGYIPFIGIVPSILLLVLESRQNRFVRFHAKQALMAQIAFWVIWTVLTIASDKAPGPLSVLFFLVRFPVFIGAFVGFIMMMARAYKGERVKIPIIGEQAE